MAIQLPPVDPSLIEAAALDKASAAARHVSLAGEIDRANELYHQESYEMAVG